MSIETHTSTRDPRTALVREKYFSLRPKPLERWLWQQGLPQAAERVFWVHWEEGMKAGDWCSQVPLKLVASMCCVDPSTVTRAYQVLKKLDLIRREDPGRDPGNPFQQATAITEVRIPRELLTELSRAPNRPQRRQGEEGGEHRGPAPPNRAAAASGEPQRPQAIERARHHCRPAGQSRHDRQGHRQAERRRARALHRSEPRLHHAPASSKPTPDWTRKNARRCSASWPASPGRRRHRSRPRWQKGAAAQAQPSARSRRWRPPDCAGTSSSCCPGRRPAETLREILWSMEEGALNRYQVPLAINTALKLVREGRWTRPNRMPPNWRGSRAAAETCSAA